MAESNKVFVSPGVYTSERDLSFVAQSVGVTTLGIVGETLKGPAFEPIFITSYDEFSTYFGGTSAEKFVNTQIPKYESAYIAKSYLQQSNQLFVTRVLGLSGYDAGPSWSIKTIANPDVATMGLNGTGTVYSVQFSGNTGGTYNYIGSFPSIIDSNRTATYTTFAGGSSTIQESLNTLITTYLGSPSSSANTIYYFGPVSGYSSLSSSYTADTNVFGVDTESTETIDYASGTNDAWFYSNWSPTTGNAYTGYSFYSVIDSPGTGATVGTYTGNVSGVYYQFSGTAYEEYNNLVIATLRSRGISTYSSTNGPTYQVSGTNDVALITTGTYSGVSENPYLTFKVSGTTIENTNFEFETSLNDNDVSYMNKVFGRTNFAKDRTTVPLFVEEIYPTLLSYAYNQGFIRGISSNLVSLNSARSATSTSIGNYTERYQTPVTPYVVSELRGNKVYQLFRFVSISDGNDANTEIKVSIANMSFNNLTFDVIVRDFYDTDANPVVLEKFTNCTMDPNENSFVAKKIGSSDGEYSINSKFIMVEVNPDAPTTALPCGFEGYTTRQYSTYPTNLPPFPIYKTKYDFPGEIISNPPFGSTSGDDAVASAGDNVRRTYLGFSTKVGVDSDFLQYKGKINPANLCTATEYDQWGVKTQGFHMDSGATVITIGTSFTTSGDPAFDCGVASFQSEPTSESNPYYRLYSRKFTFVFQGGFDGWDIYRENRTNQDRFALGGSGFLAGACSSTRYPTAAGKLFKTITVGDNSSDWANTDYYAYLLGISTFSNPEAVNINLFVTPGVDYVNNSGVVEYAIDMVENDRADSLYITTTPDFNLYQPTTDSSNLIYPQEAVDSLETAGIDSNYTATYYPWVLTRDTVNNTQIYLPATAEVTRNLALTDNIAFPWFAAAGYTRGLVNAVKARKKLTQEDRDTLYKGRINPIATFNDVGTVIWGNKTLQVRESALDRINVRRLLLQARKLISAVAVRLLFEQNDDIVRQQFLDSVNPILDAIRRDRGLYDFRVVVQNTPEDLDRNQLVGKIYIKPTKALEFIDIEFLITPSGASFENI